MTCINLAIKDVTWEKWLRSAAYQMYKYTEYVQNYFYFLQIIKWLIHY